MRRVRLGLIVTAAGALGALPAAGRAPRAAALRVCVLDDGVLMAKSTVAAAMAARFREVREAAQRRFDAESRALDAEGAAATPARREALRRRGEEINRDLAALDAELTRNVVRLALPSIRAVEAASGCAMTVPRTGLVDVADPAADISAAVVAAMNTRR